MNKSESIAGLAAALADAQAEIENAAKASKNDHLKNRYADLAEILNTVRPVFSRHGLAFTQLPSMENGQVCVETVLTHKSGEWISSTLAGPFGMMDRNHNIRQDAQSIGSAITYYRRYALAAMAGIAQEDDDGNAASGVTGNQGNQQNQNQNRGQGRNQNTRNQGRNQNRQQQRQQQRTDDRAPSADESGPSGPIELATEGQVAKIRAGLVAADVTEADFCAAQQIGCVEELPRSRVVAVIKRLTDKVNAKNATTQAINDGAAA